MDRFIIKRPKLSTHQDDDNSNTPLMTPSTSVDLQPTVVSNNDSSVEILQEIQPESTPEKIKFAYKHKFNEAWRSKFAWLSKKCSTEAWCGVCNIKITGSITHLQRHESSLSHTKNYKAALGSPSVEKIFKKPVDKTIDDYVKESELKMVMFLAEHNLPFSLADHLPKLVESMAPDSKVASAVSKHIKRKKATQLATTVLGPCNKQDLQKDLQENNFSIIIDETTDISTAKCLAIICRYYKNDSIVDRFFDLLEIKSSTADDIFNAIKISLDDVNIPVANVIGLGADNCSVMMGNINGVKALFEKINPNIVTIGCTCHSFHLCASYACGKLPKGIEQFSRDIYNYFSNSSKRCIELKECEIFANEKPHAMLRPSQTRWLSLQSVVDRILQHWSSLELFFTRAALEDNIQSAQAVLNALKNPIYKIYFYFLSYNLDIINKLNLEFQCETPKIPILLTRITSLFKLIVKSFLKKDYIDAVDLNDININNPHNYMSLDQIYCGAKVELAIKNGNVDAAEIKSFKIRALDFYIELARQIKKRFNFNDKVLKFVSNFNPNIVLSGEITSISVTASLLFPYLNLDIEDLDFEYRLMAETEEIKKRGNCDLITFWNNVDKIKNGLNEKMFPNVMKLVKVVLALPHSSAAAERIFSQLNLIKSKSRNRLLVKTCAALLHCKDLLRINKQKCFEWAPSQGMIKYSRAFIESQECLDEDIIFE